MSADAVTAFWRAVPGTSQSVSRTQLETLATGLLRLRRHSELFERRRKQLEADSRDARSVHFTVIEADRHALLERPELYRAARVPWIPRAARWSTLRSLAGQPNLPRLIDTAILAFEDANPGFRNEIARGYGRALVWPQVLVDLMILVDHLVLSAGPDSSGVVARIDEALREIPTAGHAPLGATPEARRRALRSLTTQAPNGTLLDRLDDQLRELDRLIDANRRSGGDD